MQAPLTETVNPLTLQLLEWITHHPRSYADVLDAWRTTCPRLSIFEDACIDGLIECGSGAGTTVSLSPKGKVLLQAYRTS